MRLIRSRHVSHVRHVPHLISSRHVSQVRHVPHLIQPRHVSQVRYVWYTERPARLSALAELAERALHVSMLERASKDTDGDGGTQRRGRTRRAW